MTQVMMFYFVDCLLQQISQTVIVNSRPGTPILCFKTNKIKLKLVKYFVRDVQIIPIETCFPSLYIIARHLKLEYTLAIPASNYKNPNKYVYTR